jgi:Cu2+-exporting ATPase
VGTPNDTSASLFYRTQDGAVTPITFEEHARAGLSEFLSSEKDLARPVTLLSGDSATAVERFANSAGISIWLARQSPADKLNILKAAQAEGNRVMMIGDGINDTVALSAADVSVSFAEATQIAQTSADIVLIQPDLRRISQAMTLSRRARRLIHQNLMFSTVYNVLTVPLALAGLLSPALAALLMSASSIAVMANGYRLRGVK